MENDLSQNVHEELAKLKQIIKKLKSENFQLRNIIEDLPGNIYWKNKEGVYQGRNKTSAESLRHMNLIWKLDDIIGKTDYELFPKEMADKFREHDNEVIENGKELIREEITITPSGEKIIQLSTKRPLYNEKGSIVGIVGNTVDITYLKQIEAELRKSKERAEQANIIKSEFIRNMEHDIRTPLSGIWGIVNQLSQRETEQFKKELLEDVTNCAKELLDYCNGILDFSKIESGTLALLEKKFDIRALVESVIHIERPAAKLKQLELSLEYDNNLPNILLGDPYRLQRILINLVSNAIKFTKQGFVKLGVKLIKISEPRTVIVRFIIQDSGIGIPAEKQDFIYETFSRLNPSNKGHYKGIGLGLRIVKQFMKEMGGEIELISDPGKGTSFICTLPFKLPLVNDLVRDD